MNASPTSQPVADGGLPRPPGLFRRLASGLYDALIVLAIFMLATFLVMPFTRSHALESFYAGSGGLKLLYQLGLLTLGYLFFAGFWTHGGQTIGMRTWKLRVLRFDGAALDWYRALLRYLAMLVPWLLLLLGIELLLTAARTAEMWMWLAGGAVVFLLAVAGFLWPAFDRQGLAWHDRLSGTYLLSSGKPDKTPPA